MVRHARMMANFKSAIRFDARSLILDGNIGEVSKRIKPEPPVDEIEMPD